MSGLGFVFERLVAPDPAGEMAGFEFATVAAGSSRPLPSDNPPGAGGLVAGFDPLAPAGEMAGFGPESARRRYFRTVPRSMPRCRAIRRADHRNVRN